MKRRYYLPLLICLGTVMISASFHQKDFSSPPYLDKGEVWADSILQSYTLEEKIGQLFMVAAYSNKGPAHVAHIDSLIEKYKIGGLIFFQGGPIRQARLTNHYQSTSKTPLMIAMDAEWGLSMRLDSTTRFPRQLMLGAIQDNMLIYQMGREIAKQCRALGVHISFSPVVDVNNNPNNPVIGDRSFGENRQNVAMKGIAYMQGLQDGNVLACAKHFPGHGDTDKDSHKTLPVISQDITRLRNIELYPFKQLITKGVGSVMAAHLFIPALDSTKDRATSLSPKVINGLLKKGMNFKGLVFTDALNMRGVSKFYQPGALDLLAFQAGNDVLLFPENVPAAIAHIRTAIQQQEVSEEQLNATVKKILQLKYWSGAITAKPLIEAEVLKDLNNPFADLLKRQLVKSAVTVVQDGQALLPIKDLKEKKIVSITLGKSERSGSVFLNTLDNYAKMDRLHINKDAGDNAIRPILNKLKEYDVVIVGLTDMSRSPSRNFGISPQTSKIVSQIALHNKTILTVFGSPYSLKYLNVPASIICAYDGSFIAQEISAQIIFGSINAKGKLPVGVGEKHPYGSGLKTGKLDRLEYSIPEDVGIERDWLHPIDTIVQEAIRVHATPGCQVLVAQNGKVIYHKSFGHHTYDSLRPVRNTDLYDIASITKVAATTLSLMKLEEEGDLRVRKPISHYLPELKKTNKHHVRLKDVLLHQAGLTAWIPFYRKTLDSDGFCDENYCYAPNDQYSIEVADELYINNEYLDTIWNTIIKSDISPKHKYLYSDLGFYFNKKIIEKLSGKDIQTYLDDNFYAGLGLQTMGYLPRDHYSLSRIIPTEWDSLFRRQLIHGYVHDQGAAMMGGIAGHAGLFCNANDLAILMQMLINNGEYGGEQYLQASTIHHFTSKQVKGNRRALGFDRPLSDRTLSGPTSPLVSSRTFGHTGFTGTAVWADPVHDIVYIFLSNRVYPDAGNRKLAKMDIRTRIQTVIYQALEKKEQEPTIN